MTPPKTARAEDISMEDVLGAGTRKQPVSRKESADERSSRGGESDVLERHQALGFSASHR